MEGHDFHWKYYTSTVDPEPIPPILVRLRRARIRCGMTLRTAASALGVSHTALRHLETGELRLTLGRALELCVLYGVPLQYLLQGRSTLGRGGVQLRTELVYYGMEDLSLPATQGVVALRRREEVVADALREPDARVLLRLPALLMRADRLSPPLLEAFAQEYDVIVRLGWILDLTHDLVATSLLSGNLPDGLEGGSPWRPPADLAWDDLGLPGSSDRLPRLWRRWRIGADVRPGDFVSASAPLLEAADE